MILASEDIGEADPTALPLAVAAAQATQLVGLPEAGIILSQAVIHCALAPKSNAVVAALGKAQADIKAGLAGRVPAHLRDAHYAGARRIDHGKGYRYSHDYPGGVVAQQYAPDEVAGRDYYVPSDHGAERGATDRLARLRAILRGERDNAGTQSDNGSAGRVNPSDSGA
jgi:putative ATPase